MRLANKGLTIGRNLILPILIAGMCLGGEASAQSGLRPAVQDLDLTVTRGNVLPIKLVASTTSIRRIEFVLSDTDALKHGTLSNLRKGKANNEAIVLFTPNPAGPDAVEEFTYRAKQPPEKLDSPVLSSLSASVRIRIREAYADLVVEQRALDFGQVFVGNRLERVLKVSNKGGAPYEEEVALPSGLSSSLMKEGRIVIPPKTTLRLPITYTPTKPGREHHAITLPAAAPSNRAIRIAVNGAGVAPFRVSHTELKLDWDPKTETRSGTLRVENALNHAQDLSITGPPELKLPAKLNLPSHGHKEIAIAIPAISGRDPIKGSIEIHSASFRQTVALNAEQVPGHLVVTTGPPPESLLDFTENKSGCVQFELENQGASQETVFLTIHHEFEVRDLESGTPIAPGDSLSFSVCVKRAAEHDRSGKFVLRCGVQLLKYELFASGARDDERDEASEEDLVVDESTKLMADDCDDEGNDETKMLLETRRLMAMSKADRESEFYHQVGGTMKDADFDFDTSIPTVNRVAFNGGGKDFLKFSWDTLNGPVEYRIYYQRMKVNAESGRIEKLWLPVPAASFEVKIDDERTRARMRNLRPAATYHYRIIGLTRSGRASIPSRVFSFNTAVPTSSFVSIAGWTVFGLIFGSIAIIVYRRIRRQKFYRRYY